MALSDVNLEASVSDAVPLSAQIEGPTSPTSVVAGDDVPDESTHRPDDLMWSKQELRAAQLADSDIKVVTAWLSETTEKPPWKQVAIYGSTTKALWHQWSRFCLRKGVLYRKFWSGDGLSTSLQLVAPYQHRMEFIRLAHENMTSGHLGRRRAEAQVQRRGYWPGWSGDVCRFLRTCRPCMQYHCGPTPRLAQLKLMLVGQPFESFHRHHWSSSPFFKRSRLFAYGDGPFHEVGGSNTAEKPHSAYCGLRPDGERVLQIRSTSPAAQQQSK